MAEFFGWVLLALLAMGFWQQVLRGYRGEDINHETPTSDRLRPTQVAAYHWPPHPGHHFDFEVVGESHYQRALARLAGDHGDDSPRLETVATLVPETNNRHDKSAVRVDIGGHTVGYLSREDARSFRRRLGRLKLSGQTTTCNAIIIGGFITGDGSRAHYGVALDMKPFE